MNNKGRLITLGVFIGLIVVAVLVYQFVLKPDDEESAAELLPTSPAGSTVDLFPDAYGGVVSSVQITDMQTGDTFAAELNVEELREQLVEGLDEETGTIDTGTVVPEWTITEAMVEPEAGEIVDTNRLNASLTNLPNLIASRTLSDVDGLVDFGLGTDARYEVTFTTVVDGSYSFTVGNQNVGATSYYVQLPGDSNVYLVGTYTLADILDMLANPPYITEPTAEAGE